MQYYYIRIIHFFNYSFFRIYGFLIYLLSRDVSHEVSYTREQQQDSARFAVARMYNLLH